jgi:phage gp36-like protein
MGRYIEWDDVVNRYPELDTVSGADEMGPTHIDHAESFIDSILSSHFTPPFSSNNMTVKDLSIDNVYYRAGKFKLDNAAQVWSDTLVFIEMLKNGQASMISDSGELLGIRATGAIYSNTQSYHSSFGMDDPICWAIDSDHQIADADARL